MQSLTLYTEQWHSGSFVRTSHPALTRVNSSGFTLRSTHWYFSLGTWCLFQLVLCSGTREEQKLLITEQICTNSPPSHSCPLVYLLPSPPAGQAKKKKTTDPVVSWAVSLSSNTSQLRRDSRCSPIRSASGFSNALRSLLRPEDCPPVCTRTHLNWPGTLSSCQTHTHAEQHLPLLFSKQKLRWRSESISWPRKIRSCSWLCWPERSEATTEPGETKTVRACFFFMKRTGLEDTTGIKDQMLQS